MYTLADARAEVAPVVSPGGTCASGGFVDRRINTALRRLMLAHDAPETMGILKVSTDKNYVTLPRGFKAPRLVNICKTSRPLYHYSYTYSPVTPGEHESEYSSETLETSPATYFTAFDIVAGHSLVAFSSSQSDEGKKIKIYGRRPNGEEVVGGFEVIIHRWQNGVEGEIDGANQAFLAGAASVPDIDTITNITLPTGLVGYVSLMGINTSTWNTYFYSKYHPEEIKPGYSRIYIRNTGCCPSTESRCISILGKRDFIPLTRDDELLPVQSLDAIKFMVMAVMNEDQQNPGMAQTYQSQAMSALNAHSRNTTDGATVILGVRDDMDLSGTGQMYWG